MKRSLFTSIAVGLGAIGALLLSPACTSDSPSGPETPEVNSVVVEIPSLSDTMFVGTNLQLRARIRARNGEEFEHPATWQSDNPAVAVVAANGLVTGVASGTANIYVVADKVTALTHVHVRAPVNAVTIEPALATLDVAEAIQLNAALRDGNGNVLDRPITWTTSDKAIADVSNAGLVTAVGAGTATISAEAEGKTGTAAITVLVPVALVDVTPATAAITLGTTVQLTAVPRDAAGNALVRPVDWTSSNTAVATVDAAGLVSGLTPGSATITATARGKSGASVVTVRVPVASITISDPGTEPVAPGATLQLTATAYDAGGAQLPGRNFQWASSDAAVATVDNTGLVTGVAQGTANISASADGITASVSIRVAGEVSTLGNNLSNPVIFAEGIGVTGLAVATDPGLRPTAAEGITVDQLPFWYSGNVSDYTLNNVNYFLQQGANTWQAEWVDEGAGAMQQVEVDWGDNLSATQFNSHQNIRIEVVLYDKSLRTLKGFNMAALYGTGETEMQGTDGTMGDFTPTVYAVTPRLIIQKLNDQTMQVVETVFDGAIHEGFGGDGPGAFSAEVNVGGRLGYGYNLLLQNVTLTDPTIHKYGWWRITFTLDAQANVNGQQIGRHLDMTSMAPASGQFLPQFDAATQTTWIDINIKQASGGGGGGGGGHTP
jgi:uncharacterized protein YjdB